MGRLIEEDAVITVLKETGIIQDNDLGHLVIDEINRIPTAYNPEKIMTAFKKEMFETTNSRYSKGYNAAMKKAVDIIENAGKE